MEVSGEAIHLRVRNGLVLYLEPQIFFLYLPFQERQKIKLLIIIQNLTPYQFVWILRSFGYIPIVDTNTSKIQNSTI